MLQKKISLPVREDFIENVTARHTLNIALLSRVKVNLIGGHLIFLVGKQPDIAEICLQWDTVPELCPKIFMTEDTLHIESSRLRPFYKQTSKYIVEVTLPPHIDISARLNVGGTVYIDEFTRNLEVFVRAGDVQGITHAKKAQISVQAGNIHLVGLTGDATIKNKLGDVKVGFNVINKDSKIDLSTIAGDIQLFVPHLFMSVEGQRKVKKNGYLENPVQAQMHATTRLGDIRILNNHTD